MTDTEAQEFAGERLRMLQIAHLLSDPAQIEPLLEATGVTALKRSRSRWGW